jgi:hypothetical protein
VKAASATNVDPGPLAAHQRDDLGSKRVKFLAQPKRTLENRGALNDFQAGC